jgi:hypothetical protein
LGFLGKIRGSGGIGVGSWRGAHKKNPGAEAPEFQQ